MRTCYAFNIVTLIALAGAPVSARQAIPFTAATIDAGNSGDCKALADLDGDGKADAIIGGGSLSWYESGAAYAKHIIRASPMPNEFTTDMQAADVDGDGDIDLIIPDSGPNNTGTIYWFENPRINVPEGVGSDPRIGANWMSHIIGVQGAVVHDVEAADLDNDGRIDIVTSGHGVAKLWKQVTPTSWTMSNISSAAGNAGISFGDFDHDGYRDIATPTGWMRNPHDTIAGTWIFYPITQASGEECLVADLNGDGRPDLLTCPAHTRGAMVWFECPATPTSPTWTRRVIDASMGAHHPEAVDFDRNGTMDILMGLELLDVSVYVNNGGVAPTFTKNQLDNKGGHNARAADIDGDGFPDVLGCDFIGHAPARIYISQLVGPTPCYPNCDGTGGLTANDFQCFLTAFVAASTTADCDGVGGLTANDFQCFLDAYVAGCP